MKGSQSHELETDIPASELWEVYGTLHGSLLLLPKLLPRLLAKVEVDVEAGDGGVCTILQLTFAPGIPGLENYKEKFVRIDNKNYVKEAESIDGDILKLGFLYYTVRFEIVPKGPASSVIRSTIEYEVGNGGQPELLATLVGALAAIAESVTGYIKEQNIAHHRSGE